MTEFLSAIGLLTISCLTIAICYALYVRFTTGLWPSETYKKLQEAKLEASQNGHKVFLANRERDLLSKINGQAAEIICLNKRIQDLESDIDNLRTQKDTVEDTFLTFISSLKE